MRHDEAITIRLARLDDVDRAPVLLYSAYVHMQESYPLRVAGGNRFSERS